MKQEAPKAPDPDTLAEVAAAWPPAADDAGDYRREPLAATVPVAACRLPGGAVVALAANPASARLALVPLAATGGADRPLRRARPGDGAAAALVRALATADEVLAPGWGLEPASPVGPAALEPAAAERGVATDETNESVVVGDAAIVKWIRHPSGSGDRADRLLRHLWQAGFGGVPAYHGRLVAPGPAGAVTAALVGAYLPGASDGWTWAVDALLGHLAETGRCRAGCPAGFSRGLGALTAGLHFALATPSATIPGPVAIAGRDEPAGWAAAGRARLADAVACTVADEPALADELATAAAVLAADIDRIADADGTPVQPIHGDLHVGQVLRAAGRLAIIDFDGNPTIAVPPEREPAARDLASLLCSIDHVGRIAIRRAGPAAGPAAERWIRDAIAACTDAYEAGLAAAGRPELLDRRLLRGFRAEQEARELIYAARFLPRWRYAPLGAIRAMVSA